MPPESPGPGVSSDPPVLAAPAWTAAEQVIASTMAARPNEDDFYQARVIVAALQRAGFAVVRSRNVT